MPVFSTINLPRARPGQPPRPHGAPVQRPTSSCWPDCQDMVLIGWPPVRWSGASADRLEVTAPETSPFTPVAGPHTGYCMAPRYVALDKHGLDVVEAWEIRKRKSWPGPGMLRLGDPTSLATDRPRVRPPPGAHFRPSLDSRPRQALGLPLRCRSGQPSRNCSVVRLAQASGQGTTAH